MTNEEKLIQTLCGMLPYELKEKRGKITGIDLNHNGYKTVNIDYDIVINNVRYCTVDIEKIKPILHSLDKLTEPILDGGLIPIVELAKMVKNEYEWAVLRNNVCSCTFYSFTYRYNSFYLKDSSYRLVMGQLELFEKLKEWHFNIYDLPKEMYIEKSKVKI